jgi:hypothetical protein
MDDSPPVSHLTPVLESLTRLDDRLARIEQRLEHFEALSQLERAVPNLAAMAVDSLDDAARVLQGRGVDLQERLHNALVSLERLTSAQATAQLTQLIEVVQQAPNALAMLVDVFDEHSGALRDRGVDLEERLASVASLIEKLTAPGAIAVLSSLLEHLPSLDRLLGSGVLGAGPVEIVGRAGQALTEAQRLAVRPVGAFGLLRALSDADVQHALGFAVAFARALGRSLQPSFSAHALPSGTP